MAKYVDDFMHFTQKKMSATNEINNQIHLPERIHTLYNTSRRMVVPNRHTISSLVHATFSRTDILQNREERKKTKEIKQEKLIKTFKRKAILLPQKII